MGREGEITYPLKKGLTVLASFVIKGSSLSGNNSVVECDLAKVEVAGSNPVSRSNLQEMKGSRQKCSDPFLFFCVLRLPYKKLPIGAIA